MLSPDWQGEGQGRGIMKGLPMGREQKRLNADPAVGASLGKCKIKNQEIAV